MLVHFVGEIKGVVLHAQIRDHLQLRLGEDFSDGIVGRVDHDHAGLGAELGSEFCGIQDPIGGGKRLRRVGAFARPQRDEDGSPAGDPDERLVTIEERLDDNHLRNRRKRSKFVP